MSPGNQAIEEIVQAIDEQEFADKVSIIVSKAEQRDRAEHLGEHAIAYQRDLVEELRKKFAKLEFDPREMADRLRKLGLSSAEAANALRHLCEAKLVPDGWLLARVRQAPDLTPELAHHVGGYRSAPMILPPPPKLAWWQRLWVWLTRDESDYPEQHKAFFDRDYVRSAGRFESELLDIEFGGKPLEREWDKS